MDRNYLNEYIQIGGQTEITSQVMMIDFVACL